MQTTPGESLVREFALDLRELRIACGNPSYAQIIGLAEKHGNSIAKSTVSDMLNGKRLPARDLVLAVVRALLHAARGPNGSLVAEDHQEVRAWGEKWATVLRGTQAAAESAVGAARPALSSARAGSDREAGPVSPSSDGQAVVLQLAVAASNLERWSQRPSRTSLVVPRVRVFQELLKRALSDQDDDGRVLAKARHGCYAFYDVEGEPIYVGQTSEQLGNRVRRHLTSHRSDAVASHVLDVQEVAELELWPVWSLEEVPRTQRAVAQKELDRIERAVYVQAVAASRYGVLLNEKVPRINDPVELPESRRYPLIDEQMRMEQANLDVRIKRNAEMLARLSAMVLERGQVSEGLRRALAVRAARTTDLAVRQLAYVTGGAVPEPAFVNLGGLVHGDVESAPHAFSDEE